ncbi:unnamed protein product [Darwinula stevensoni]|uniref:FAD-binding domain-containing protein n=1 Tax=Darwinula stevensoni TaxID=69355 RepID=A0A7R9A5L3_9CRUS|nr:unnamed protein product [Darwinula stevensoni]CAG0886719.1 unnamed protein product [Darwinula stevensoni]
MIIGADGWGSRVREAMGVKHVGWDYDQTAIVATLRLSEATANNVAWQRFLPTGPLALLPLNSQQSSLVWSTTKKEASRLMSLTEEEFTDALNHAIWDDKHRIRGIDDVLDRWRSLLGRVLDLGMSVRQLPPSIMAIEGGSRACFPLGLGHATEYVRLRAALIGDAAHRIHPMAGQGVNMGFADAVALTKCLSRAVYEGRDVGNLSHLLEYETERQRQVVPTLATVDGLYRLYSTQFSPIVLLRSLGLSFTNAFSPAKRVIMARTSV